MGVSVIRLLNDIREMRKKLDEIEEELLRLIAESEEPEIVNEELYEELLRKAEELRKNPEKGMRALRRPSGSLRHEVIECPFRLWWTGMSSGTPRNT